MIWNRKKSYWGICIEQIFVFIVLSFCLVTAAGLLSKVYTPGALNIDNVIVIAIPNDYSDKELMQKANALVANIKQYPQIRRFSKTKNFIPYISNKLLYDSVCIDNKMVETRIKYADENAFGIFKPVLEEGVWLNNEIKADGSYAAIITRQLADKLNWNTSLGKRITVMHRNFTIVGVIEGLKENELIDSPASLILPIETAPNTTKDPLLYAAELNKEDNGEFASFFSKEYNQMFPDNELALNCLSLRTLKNAEMYGVNISISAMTLICIFIILYTFIGNYGLISLFSENRTGEYALRMALGLTKKSLIGYVLFENLVITLVSTIPGIIIILNIIQSYSQKTPIIISILIALALMLLFSLFSAWLPAFRMSKLDPARVLMNDM